MTASKLRLASLGLVSVLAATGARSAPDNRTIRVDCDRGGSLQAALQRAGAGPARIEVLGTCVGVFVTTGDGIEIVGRSPAESRIRTIGAGNYNTALNVFGPGQLNIRNLSIVDSNGGLQARGPGRTVVLENCEITGNQTGIYLQNGVTLALRESRVRSNQWSGITADTDVWVAMVGGAISDNYQAVYMYGNSRLDVSDAEVRGNRHMGVEAATLCTVTAARTTFLDNGQGHARVDDRSAITVLDATVGQPGDATASSVVASGGSRSRIVFQSPGILYGTVYAVGGSSLVVEGGGSLHDGANLQDFSWAKVTDATVEGELVCQTGSNALCLGYASVSAPGCGPVPSSCNGTPVPAPEPPAFLKSVPEGRITPQPR